MSDIISSKTLFGIHFTKSIWTNRPLFSFCSFFIAGSIIGFLLSPIGKAIFAGVTVISAMIFIICALARRITKAKVLIAIVCCAVLLISLTESHMYFDLKYARLQDLNDTECKIKATVIGRRYAGANLSSFDIELNNIDGDSASDGSMAILDCMFPADLQTGDKFTADVTACALKNYSANVYNEQGLIGQGYCIAFTSYADTSVDILEKDISVKNYFLGLNEKLSSILIHDLGDSCAAELSPALLLGSRNRLSNEIRRDFERSGVSHILALSGLHVTVLFGILELLLRSLFIPKKPRAALLGFLALGYLFVTGCSPSATRAVIMLLATYLSYAFCEESDPLTSLGFAGALILALSPTSVADLGFWMSFSATFGLITIMPRLTELLPKSDTQANKHSSAVAAICFKILHRTKRGLISFISGISVGAVATTFTLWAIALSSGKTSLLSPLITLILSPLCALILGASALLILLSGTPLAVYTSSFIIEASETITDITAYFSSFSWHIVSLDSPFIPVICIIALIFTFIPLPIIKSSESKKNQNSLLKRIFVVPIASIILISGLVTIGMIDRRHQLDITYIQPSSASEYLILQNGSGAVICDFSNGSNSSMNQAVRYAKKTATKIDALMLTHYHSRTPGTLANLFERESIKQLWLPSPTDENDYYLMLSCIEKAEFADPPVCVKIYKENEELKVFTNTVLSLSRQYLSRSAQPALLFTLDTPHNKLTFCSAAAFECEDEFVENINKNIEGSTAVIYAYHGPITKTNYDISPAFKSGISDNIIFATKEISSYATLPDPCPNEYPSLTVGQTKLTFILE